MKALDSPLTALRGAVLIVVVAWLPILLVWGPLPHALTFDDAWYYFEIARNVADGAGSTFDGINETNGYHPLWLGLCALGRLVGADGTGFVRLMLVVQLVTWTGVLWLVASRVGGWSIDDERARRRCTIAVAAVVVLAGANPFVLKLFVNGLESGVLALAYAGLLLLATPRDRPSAFGVLAAVAFLARTDALVVVACAGLWALAQRTPTRRLVLAFGPVVAVTAVYLAANQVAFGHPLQISGVVKRLPLTAGRVLAFAVVVAVAAAIAAAAWRVRGGRLARTAAFFHATGWFAAGVVLLTGYYRILSTEDYLWYYAPHALYLVILLVHVAADLTEGAAAEAEGGTDEKVRAATVVAAVLAAPLAAGLVWTAVNLADPELYGVQVHDREAAEWMNANLPDDAVVAAWDAGVLGYFTDQPVVNLDGVVNSFEWRDAVRNGTTREFLRREGVTHIANHGDPVRGDDPVLRALARELTGEELNLLHRIDFVYAGSTPRSGAGRRPFAVFVYELPVTFAEDLARRPA